MSTFDMEKDLLNALSGAGLARTEEVRVSEPQLDLNPATLLFHKVDETKKVIRSLRQTVKSHINEMATIGGEAFSISHNNAASLLEASCITLETAIGQVILPVYKYDLESVQALKERISQLEQINALLESQVNADALTGLLNRRGLENALTRELSYAQRTGSPLLAALADLDDFKVFNDTYGHHIGDEVLRCVAQVMKDKIRACDWSARIGGDEFLILLPSTTLQQGINVLDRIRLSVCDRTIVASRDLFLHTSISIGITQLQSNTQTLEDVLRATTSVLKKSKAAGKNRISTAMDLAHDAISDTNTLFLEKGESSAATNGRDEKC